MEGLGRPSTIRDYTLSFNYLMTFVVYSDQAGLIETLFEDFDAYLKGQSLPRA